MRKILVACILYLAFCSFHWATKPSLATKGEQQKCDSLQTFLLTPIGMSDERF